MNPYIKLNEFKTVFKIVAYNFIEKSLQVDQADKTKSFNDKQYSYFKE